MSDTWGRNIRITLFGQSHSDSVGVVIDGLKAGLEIDMGKVAEELMRRQGGDRFSTPRKEKDIPEIVSGMFEGKTAGAPLCVLFKNSNTKSKDYSLLKDRMRPSHADYPAYVKHDGYNDYTGGGHFSGRLTLPLVFAGAVAKQLLEMEGVTVASHIRSIADINDLSFYEKMPDREGLEALRHMSFPLLDESVREKMEKRILDARDNGDSVGGRIETVVTGLDAGYGDPFFDSMESVISHMMFSVPAVKGIEFGKGFELAGMTGYEARDEYYYDENGKVRTRANNNGGILGGISNGQDVIFTVAIKPTASISRKMNTIDVSKKENTELEITGRHDPVITRRAVPVIEAATAVCILDFLMEGK